MKIKLIDFGCDENLWPERQHYNDTGADVYLQEDIELGPNETLVVPCKFGINLPDGYNAHFQTRTSIAKQGILVHQCAIDAGYKGEIHMIVQNLTANYKQFKKGERLAYLEVYPIVYADFVGNLGPERNNSAFGSTGK